MTPEQCATQVLRDFNIDDISILRFPRICKESGIEWEEYPYNDIKYSGVLHKIDGEYYILINSDCQMPTRINFTKAHELGHFFLKHPGEKFECSGNDIFTTDKANRPFEVDGIVQWVTKSPNCKQPTLHKGKPLPSQSIAFKCFADHYTPPKDEYIKGPQATWGQAIKPPLEMSIPFKNMNATLSAVKW